MNDNFGFAGLILRMTARPALSLLAYGLALALIAYLLAGALLLGQGAAEGASRGGGRLGADLLVVPKGTEVPKSEKLLGGFPVSSPLPEGIEGYLTAMTGVAVVAPQYVFSSTADPCCELGNVLLVGFDTSRDFTVRPWLQPLEGLTSEREQLLAGSRVLKATGAVMRFFGQAFTLAARLERSGAETFDTALFIPLEGLKAMELSSRRGGKVLSVPWGRPSLLLVRLAASLEPQQTARLLEQRYPDIQVLTMAGPVRENRLLFEQLGRGGRPLGVFAWGVALFAGGVLQLFWFRARRQSFGLLRSFGCSKGLLAFVSAVESFMLSLAAMVAGSSGAVLTLRLCGTYPALATGLPLVSGWVHQAAACLLWIMPVFALALSVEGMLIVLFMLWSETSELLWGA